MNIIEAIAIDCSDPDRVSPPDSYSGNDARRSIAIEATPGSRQASGRRLYHLTILAIASGVLFFSIVLKITEFGTVAAPGLGQLPELCTMKRSLEMDCPGCGLTRCFISLAHGRLGDALRFNAAGYLLFAVVLYQLPYRGIQLWYLRRYRTDRCHNAWLAVVVVWVLVGALIAQWGWKIYSAWIL